MADTSRARWAPCSCVRCRMARRNAGEEVHFRHLLAARIAKNVTYKTRETPLKQLEPLLNLETPAQEIHVEHNVAVPFWRRGRWSNAMAVRSGRSKATRNHPLISLALEGRGRSKKPTIIASETITLRFALPWERWRRQHLRRNALFSCPKYCIAMLLLFFLSFSFSLSCNTCLKHLPFPFPQFPRETILRRLRHCAGGWQREILKLVWISTLTTDIDFILNSALASSYSLHGSFFFFTNFCFYMLRH